MRVIICRGEPANPTKEDQWDNLEWDDQTLMTDGNARGLFARMIAQSIQEWAEQAQLNKRITESRLQRLAAKQEVEVEAERIREGLHDGTF